MNLAGHGGSDLTYAELLGGLDDDELQVVLTRRPEAARLCDGRPVTWTTLAATLGHPAAVAGAVSSLNRFLRQVLELGCVVGGSLSPSRAEAEGLAPPVLLDAERELRRWGLAFAGDGGGLLVPVEVRTALRSPGGLRSPLTALAQNLTADELRRILAVHGVAGREQPRRKAEVIALLSNLLGRSREIRGLVGAAPGPAGAALAELRAGGGTTLALHHSKHWRRGQGWGSWQWRAEEDTPADWLLSRGLVLPTDRGYSTLEVPAEVELALRGRLFPEWEPQPPPIAARPLSEERHPVELVSEVGALLQAWGEGVPALSAGGVPVRELRRLARVLQTDVEEAQALVGLASVAGLLQERELVAERRSRSRRSPRVVQSRRAVIEPTDYGHRWSLMPEHARWLDLYRAWMTSLQLFLGDAGGQGWRTLFEVLEELPARTGALPEDLARHLAWRSPSWFRSADAPLGLVQEVASGLRRLGAGGATPLVGLSAAGRLAQRPDVALAELGAAFPPTVSDCTVTTDHRIVVTGIPDPSLGALLSRVAEVVSVQPARVYRLTAVSLARGLDDGVTAAEILETLSSRGRSGVPPNVVSYIEDVARRHGRLRVGTAAVYVATDDPALLAEVAEGRLGRSLGARRIAPNVLVLDEATAAEVVAAMRKDGLMPVIEGEAQPVTPKLQPLTPRPAPTAPRDVPELGTEEVASLVATLRRAPSRARPMLPAEVARLAAAASRQRSPVEVLVESSEGSRYLHLQHVYLQGSRLVGMEPVTFTHCEVDLSEVVWLGETPDAQAVLPFMAGGEGDEKDWDDDSEDDEGEEGDSRSGPPPRERRVVDPDRLERRRQALARARGLREALRKEQ